MSQETPARRDAIERRHPLPGNPPAPPRTGRELHVSLSSIRDTLSRRHHSLDFTFAHAHYLRSRVLAVGLIFALLTPLWAVVDALVLPRELVTTTLIGRGVLMVGLASVLLLARLSRDHVGRIRLCAGMLLALPAAFYVLVLMLLPPGEAEELAGYGFIPFLLVAALSVFPFTILESLAAGLAMLWLLGFAQLVDGSWMTARGLEDFWLLGSLLVVSMAANHFQLSLLLRIYRQATHDPLTGLYNRRALEMHLDKIQAWQRDIAQKTQQRAPRCAVLILDIDHFKRINDQHGHSVGDMVLAQFATLLTTLTREQDCVARYGGEEFVVVLVDTDGQRAREVAERIRHSVANSVFNDHEHQPVEVTTSIGISHLHVGEPATEALRRSDEGLYIAKEHGRNRVVVAETRQSDTPGTARPVFRKGSSASSPHHA